MFVWSDQTQTAFDTLKQLLTTASILSYPLPQVQPFLLDCDASNVGVGAVLSQVKDGEERVNSYFSKCLSRAERQYCTTRKELLAVVTAVKHAVCTKIYHIGVGYAQPVDLGRCHTGMLKHPCDSTMSDIRWNALDLISLVLSRCRKRDTDISWWFHVILRNG